MQTTSINNGEFELLTPLNALDRKILRSLISNLVGDEFSHADPEIRCLVHKVGDWDGPWLGLTITPNLDIFSDHPDLGEIRTLQVALNQDSRGEETFSVFDLVWSYTNTSGAEHVGTMRPRFTDIAEPAKV